jgi:pimeloyl-ACP methyl ester carboxylesterase
MVTKLATQYEDLGDVQLAYTEHGNGPDLILLHGNSENKGIFSSYQQTYFRTYHTLAIDSRGHGETISDDRCYRIGQYCDDVIRLCRAKGISRAGVIGYSDGGNIALFLASRAPGLFYKLAAISPNYLVSGTNDDVLRLMKGIYQGMKLLRKLGFPTQKAILRFDLMLEDIGISAEELTGIRTNLRILYAEHDMIKESHILEIGRLVPGAIVKKFDGCNHLSIFSKKEAIEELQAYFQDGN